MGFRRSLRTFVALLTIPMLISVTVLPDLALAQSSGQSSAAEACVQGTADAERNTSSAWIFAGCLGLVGLLAAYLIAPNPPATGLLGKSPEYVAMYTDCYRNAGKSAQGKKALIGCLISGVAWLAYVVIVVSAVDSIDDDPYN